MPRYLTKSLHKKALECPTKLYYNRLPQTYDNNMLDDPFLMALAKGGFQVGELAKIYHPGGTEITALSHDEAVAQTKELLQREEVIIYEPAFTSEKFFIRVDILIKKGNSIRLLEVKAKSFDPREENFYNKTLKKTGVYQFVKDWKPYLYDTAFQTMVCRMAHPEFNFHPFMVFADKSQVTSVQGLNQRFLIAEENKRIKVKIAPGTDLSTVGQKILCTVNVSDEVERTLNGTDQGAKTREELKMPSFYDEAKAWAEAAIAGKKILSNIKKDCRDCEFRTHGQKQSGFVECWQAALKAEPIDGELVLDLWNYRKADQLIEEGRLYLREVTQDDLKIEEDPGAGMTIGQRQWLQVEKVSNGDKTPSIDLTFLRHAMSTWIYPLHCIDFETTMVAIPFHAGRRPYEQIAFQFSHHIISEDGRVYHAGEYLHKERGGFPNFDFLRSLKAQLEKDKGSIFRYSNHENTVLRAIYEQLVHSQEQDKDELMAFIKTITRSKDPEWIGPRNMIDLWEIIKKAYYHPLTKGSNSIKRVLPAVLHESTFLQKKYSNPIYGADGGMVSLNFKDHAWLKRDESGKIIDPYKQLPSIFEGIDEVLIDNFLTDGEELAEGGAAMMAFAKMQFTEMSDLEMQSLSKALLRYCELDTLAMVMLIEHFFEITGQRQLSQAG